jgi:hypothetical protein
MLRQGIEAALHRQVDGLVGILGALFLLLHFGLESFQVHSEALFFGDFLGQLQGEAVGVVENEGVFPGDLLRPWSCFLFRECRPAASHPAPGFPGSGLLPGPARL